VAEDLLTSSLTNIYAIVHGIGEKIAGLFQNISGVALPQVMIEAIGLLVILAILLVFAIVANKSIKRKKSKNDTSTKPKNEQQHIDEKETETIITEMTDNKLPAYNTISEPRIDEKETDKISRPKNYRGSNLSGGIKTKDGNNLENLINELRRIDLIIRLYYEKWRKEHSKDDDNLLGLCITENEVNAIMEAQTYELEANSMNEKIQTICREIYKSLEKEKSLRLHDLQKLFDLDSFEVGTLLICLASELDMKCEKLCSYLQNDITKKRPIVNLVINMLCPSLEEKFKAREYFSPAAPLIRNRLIYLRDDETEGHIPLLSRSIKIDERIINYLLGLDEIDQRIRTYSTMKNELIRSFDDLIIPDSKKKAFVELLKHRANIGNPIFYFHGAYGTGKKLTAGIICKELGMPLLVVDSNVFMKEDPLDTLRIIIREARLQNSLLYLEGFGVLLEQEAEINVAGLFQELELFENWIFLAGELPYTPASVLEKHGFIDVAFPIPSFEFRKQLWEKLLKENVPNLDIDALASKFNFSGGQIEDAISSARNLAMVKNPENPAISMDDLYRGCKAQSNKSLSAFAKNIPPRYKWEDIVLPKDIEAQLREVSGYIKHKGKVYTDWGFDVKLSLGKGLNVLFSGSSGAGKTMAAEVIAKESGLDLYKIDLSTVVSKYIGETEKILKKIFLEAETSNAILFFDEADALFGKRSEVKDAHDRYANIETNYLLQKMEEHEGIVILASNFKANIDEAFLRRMHFAVEFTSPEEDLRERIWTHIFPKKTKMSPDVDFSFLSKFKITGGNIKNIALNAAFLAAGDNSDEVKMEHIIRATKREFQKMGKLCTFGDFGEYYALVK
jgi:AAA+ superfamily predicted ATPase